MKKMLLLFIALLAFVVATPNAFAGDFDSYGALYGSVNKYQFSKCYPDCGVDRVQDTNGIGLKLGTYYTGLRKYEPLPFKIDLGAEVDFNQTTSIELPHDQNGAMDGRLISLNLLARVPLMTSTEFPNGRVQPYIGYGIGSEFTKISLRSGDADCNHSARAWMVGANFAISKQFDIFTEYEHASTHHDFVESTPTIKVIQDDNLYKIGIKFHPTFL